MTKLWKKRFTQYLRHRFSYLSYIFQGGFLIALLLLGGIGAVYYQRFLTTVPEDFPSLLVTALIISLVISSLEVKFFLLPADKVFLLAYEGRMKKYIQYSSFYSYIRTLLIVIFTGLLTIPLLIKLDFQTYDFIWGGIILLVLSFLSLVVVIHSYFIKKKWVRLYLFIFNSVALYAALKGAFWICLLLTVIPLSFTFISPKKMVLQWERLIELEASQKIRFEQFANLFVDVPSLQNLVRTRRYLGWVFTFIRVNDPRVYLSVRTFFRKGSYVWIYIRLVFLGALLLHYFSSEVITYLFAPLCLWITHQQLIAIKKEQFRDTFLVILQTNYMSHSFDKMILCLLLLQSLFYSLIQLPTVHQAFIVLLEGLLISYIQTMRKRPTKKRGTDSP